MEMCGQCPGAVSPDLLLGRSRKCSDEGKVMYLSLVCVCVDGSSAAPQRCTAVPQALAVARGPSPLCCCYSVVP